MYNYTMTFVYDGDFDLPDAPDVRDSELPRMVLEKMEQGYFQLVDFNLSENYDRHIIDTYIKDPALHRSVLEIRLDMSRADMKSRDAIYARCLQAMRDGELSLIRAHENDDPDLGLLQSLIVFERKDSYSETA
ncbi:hypothetical protein OGH69_08345 [Flavobacterium sp. MFBS3-15]|uniref:hypothetical protein n=1 Tax=Flavobacterium sp. MFBS3-15 TaxID=2989816 RepID=UPI00223556F2|nr:hypothetical protein [Flavobacterium sp. MFBS3-15]MCW4468969.1 hypothetical protein [Flavobacterium sp. MFBS3-15]